MSEPASRTKNNMIVVVALGFVIAIFVIASLEGGREVSEEEFGKEWPFTVSSGRVDCVDDLALIFKANGKTYALNGFATTWGIDDADLKDIWLKDYEFIALMKKAFPDELPAKYDRWIAIGAIQDAANELC